MSLHIDYCPRKRKLIFLCAWYENNMARNFPARKFDPKKKEWIIPICKKNIDYIDVMRKQVPVTISADADRAMQEMRDKTALPPPQPFPLGFPFKLEPMHQQREALDFSNNKPVFALFMDMGTGKTKVAVDLAAFHFYSGTINGMVVFCPVSLRRNWVDEIRTHCSIDLAWKEVSPDEWASPDVLEADLGAPGSRAERLADQWVGKHAPFKIMIVGIESLQQGECKGRVWDLVDRFCLAHNHMQIVDEAHNIKGPDAIRAQNIVKLGHKAKIKGILTGTPILQGLLDLYMLFEYLDPMIIGMGDYTAFKCRYALLSDDGFKRVVAYDNVEELMTAVSPYIYQCTKEKAMPYLPPKLPAQRRVVRLAKGDQEDAYRDIRKKLSWKCDDIEIMIENILAKYSALQTICGGSINYWQDVPDMFKEDGTAQRKRHTKELVDVKRNPKIIELLNVLEEMGDKSVIIWAIHRFEIEQIVQALEAKYGKGCVSQYHGGLTLEQRNDSKRKFMEGKTRFFAGTQKAGGQGLTLTVATAAIYYSNSFKLIDRLQSEDRIHRKGQDRPCSYIDIIAAGTVDIDIIAAIREKKDLADWVRDRLASGQGHLLSIA